VVNSSMTLKGKSWLAKSGHKGAGTPPDNLARKILKFYRGSPGASRRRGFSKRKVGKCKGLEFDSGGVAMRSVFLY